MKHHFEPTARQREQWKRFNALGQVTSLAMWIGAKLDYIDDLPNVSAYQKSQLKQLLQRSSYELKETARQAGWDPDKPTAGKRLYK